MGLDISLYRVLKDSKKNTRENYEKSLGEIFVNPRVEWESIGRLQESITGRQLLKKYANRLTKREFKSWDFNWIARKSKFYTGEDMVHNIRVRWVGCCSEYEDFEIQYNGETYELKIPDTETIPYYIITDYGFYVEEIKYLQRKGIVGIISQAHKDFIDYKDNFLLFVNSNAQLKALQGLIDTDLIPSSELYQLKRLKKYEYIDLNA